jgi:outer membrane biosynthesis protein TonB
MISWGSALNAQSTSTPNDQQQPQAQQPTPDNPPAQQTTPDTTPSQQQPPSAQAPSQQTPDQSQAPSTKDTMPTATDSKVFSGTVVKQGDKYVLQDDAGKTYDIDHQDEVKKFEGKRVRVQGTLDDSGKKILVK